MITCKAGFDGGLIQSFMLEVYNTDTGVLLFNITSTSEKPKFRINAQPGTDLTMYVTAMNVKGRSDQLKLKRESEKLLEKRTGKLKINL